MKLILSRLFVVTLIVSALSVLVLHSTSAAPSSTSGSKAVIVAVDSSGKVLGNVLGFNQNIDPMIVLKLNDVLVPLAVMGDELIGTAGLYFTSSDCSGVPYIKTYGRSLPSSTVMDGNVYVADLEETPQTRNFQSNFGAFHGCEVLSTSKETVEADLVGNINGFIAPFKIVSK